MRKSTSDDSQRWAGREGYLEAKDGKLTFSEYSSDADGFSTVVQWKMSR